MLSSKPCARFANIAPMNRRHFIATALGATAASGKECLPQATTFRGSARFQSVVAQAVKEGWRKLPMGQRVAQCGMALLGIPYVGYTLEIHDHVESASANFAGLDCWTFFEIALGLARMIEVEKTSYTPSDLLTEIEWTRYRAGVCNGGYLERIHYLDEWFYDNEARGNIEHVTRQIGRTEQIHGREIREMTVLWKGYRYLRENPELRGPMRDSELRLQRIPFHHIPKDRVAAMEGKIQSGDIIGIVTNQHGGYCSHVGLALRTQDGVLHFMHASKNHKKVVVDSQLSAYLNRFKYHAGIIVARPLPRSSAVTSSSSYQSRLRSITGL
jgi:hypothetical protein